MVGYTDPSSFLSPTPSGTSKGSEVDSAPSRPPFLSGAPEPEPCSPCTLCGGEVIARTRRRRTLAVIGEKKRRQTDGTNLLDALVSNARATSSTAGSSAGYSTSSDPEKIRPGEKPSEGARCFVCERVYHTDCADLRPTGLDTREALGIRGIFYSCGRCRKKRQEAYRLATTGNKSVPVGPEYQAPEIPKLWCQSFGGWKRGHPVEQPKCVWNPKLAEANGLTTDDIDEFLEKAEDVWPTQAFVHIERGSRRGSNVEEEIDNGSRRSSRLHNPLDFPMDYRAPFSVDAALGVLHLAQYNCDKALQLLGCPEFYTPPGNEDDRAQRQSIMTVKLSLPTKPYNNKWRPKDRRGRISSTPHPQRTRRLLPPLSPQLSAVKNGVRNDHSNFCIGNTLL